MAVSHVKSLTIADMTGTITVFDSQGSTGTIAATDIVRPSDWDSVHNQFLTVTGNNTFSNTTASGSNLQYSALGNLSIGGSSDTVLFSGPKMQSSYRNVINAGNLSTVNSLFSSNSASCQPFILPYDMVASNVKCALSVSVGTAANTSSAYFDLTFAGGIYKKGNSAGRIDSLVTWLQTYTVSWASNATTQIAGMPFITGTFATQTFGAGEYFFVAQMSTNSTATGGANTTALGNSVSVVVAAAINTAFFNSTAAHYLGSGSTNNINILPGLGVLSNINGTQTAYQLSNYNFGGTNVPPAPVFFELRNDTWTINP